MASMALRCLSSSSSSTSFCPTFAPPPRSLPCRISLPFTVKCNGSEPLETVNGRPSLPFPILDEHSQPKLMHSRRLENSVNTSDTRLKLFSGTANLALAKEVAWYMGIELGKVKISRFADGEINVQLKESMLVVEHQPKLSLQSFHILDMPEQIGRQTQGRESLAAKLVANQITAAGATRVLACDLHSGQSMGYFDIPIDHLYCQPVILDYLARKGIASSDLVVVSPDVGGVARARAFAKKLSDAPLAIVDKRRHAHNVAEVMNLIGDVKGKVAVMLDDMIDTAGTITKGAELLHEEGAREVYACCTHAVFSPPAIERLSSGCFQEVIVTNTIPMAVKNLFPQLTVLSTANLLGETIWRIHDDDSVSSMFQ
uniref:ribose-phosphate diphosphokinase n=1 Tax=Chenopodium quinoa TaxID=63459 RepID=A0A803LTT6_CHEQI